MASSDNITLGTSDVPGELTVRVVTVEHKKTHLKKHVKHEHELTPVPTAINENANANEEGGVHTVTIDQTKTHLKKHAKSSGDTGGIVAVPSVPSSTVVSSSSSSNLSASPSVVVMDKSDDVSRKIPKNAEEEEKKKKRRKGLCGMCCCCCPLPWYLLLGLLALLALAIGLGVGLKKNNEPTKGSTGILYDVNLKFNVYQKEVNLTLVSSLRCLVANLTDPTQFKRIVMTSWEEYNGTTFFINPDHPLNYATNCSAYFPDYTFRRLQQQNSNNWIFPTDPITLNISTVPKPGDINYTFIDALYDNEKLKTIAAIEGMEERRPAGNIPLPPSPTRTTTPTPTTTTTLTATPSNSPTPSTTATATPTSSTTPSSTPTSSTTSTLTATPTSSPTPSTTISASPTPSTTTSASPTSSITATPSPTSSITATPSTTVSATPTISVTPTISTSPSATPSPKPPQLLKDICPGGSTSNSNPRYFTVYKDYMYFQANDCSAISLELWRSDGVTTSLFYDFVYGAGSPDSFVVVNDTLYFAAADIKYTNKELWKTNGTVEGTVKIKETMAGDQGTVKLLTNVNGILFFTASTGILGQELWKSDGSEANTVMVKDINLSCCAGSEPSDLIAFKDMLFFVANDGTNGRELWKSDGSEANTVMVKNIRPGSTGSDPAWFKIWGDKMYFCADDGSNGREVWVTDGTTVGTVMVVDLNPGSGVGTMKPNFLVFNNMLYFVGRDANSGFELYKSDGIVGGSTTMVKDIAPGTNPLTNTAFLSYGWEPIIMGNNIYFAADNTGNNKNNEMWKTDGSSIGTVMVKEINPTIYNNGNADIGDWFLVNNNTLWFSAHDGVKGSEFWKTDGTAAGTSMVIELNTGFVSANNPLGGGPSEFTRMGDMVFFSAVGTMYGTELYIAYI